MRVSDRETILAWVTGVVLVGALTYLFAEPRARELGRIGDEQRTIRDKIALDERLVAQKPSWERKWQEAIATLPEYPADKDVTEELLRTLERLAQSSGVNLLRRDPEKEVAHGIVFELGIICRWQTTLDGLVRFLFDLQQQGAMLDVTQLTVSPEKDVLKGSFTVSCAYRRATAPKNSGSPPEGK